MKKITGQFTKYTVILLIVGAVLVLVGGLSVSRKAISNQREIALDMTAKTRVDVISKENAELKAENARLKKEIERLKAELEKEEEKIETATALKLAEKFLNEKDVVQAKLEIDKVNKTLLGSMSEVYQKLYDKIAKYFE